MRKNNYILVGCLAFFIGVVFFLMRGIPYGQHTEGYGAAFYPALLLGVLAVLTIVLFVQTLRLPKDEDKKEKPSDASGSSDFSFKNFGFFLVLFLLYTLPLQRIGFIINSFLFLTIGMVYLRTPLKRAVVVSIAVVAVIYVMFKIVLRVPLPPGLLGVIGL